jgi:DNA-binding transcriptional LysR family regulator
MITLYVLPPVITRFREQHPDVEVELRPGLHAAAIDRLLAYEVDAAVIGSDVDVPQVQAIPVFRDPLVLVSAPRAGAADEMGRLDDLGGATLLVPTPQTGLRHQVEGALADRGVSARLVEYPTAETIKTAVALGMGVAILPETVVAEDVGAGRLIARRFADWPDAARTVRVLVRAQGAISPPVRALVRLLQEHYGRDASED